MRVILFWGSHSFLFLSLIYTSADRCWCEREQWNDVVVKKNGERSFNGVPSVAESDSQDFRRRHADAPAVRRRGAEQVRGESSRDLPRRPRPPHGGGTWGLPLHLYHDRPSQAQRTRRLRYDEINDSQFAQLSPASILRRCFWFSLCGPIMLATCLWNVLWDFDLRKKKIMAEILCILICYLICSLLAEILCILLLLMQFTKRIVSWISPNIS